MKMDSGQSVTEYALIGFLVLAAGLGGLMMLSSSIDQQFLGILPSTHLHSAKTSTASAAIAKLPMNNTSSTSTTGKIITLTNGSTVSLSQVGMPLQKTVET